MVVNGQRFWVQSFISVAHFYLGIQANPNRGREKEIRDRDVEYLDGVSYSWLQMHIQGIQELWKWRKPSGKVTTPVNKKAVCKL